MKYSSTRGGCSGQGFEEVLLTGLAPDGGLFVPDELPRLDAADLAELKDLAYPELAFRIAAPFTGDAFAADELRRIIADSHAGFPQPEVAPLTTLGDNEYVLELFHGPTLAFKDFALQVLGRMLDHVLARGGERALILGATSGDTGSAALEGCRHSRRVDICILHPRGRVSAVQRKQMTTVAGDNVHNLAVEGNFDDCQRLVKAAFADQSFLPAGRRLVAVNSINWARIVMQIVYYFHAALRLGAPERAVSFSVPTGNFGDIHAGYLARSMGLPVERLIVATNENDILHRLISGNEYSTAPLRHTLSPSMDILVSSNFERYLFDLFDRDHDALVAFMAAGAGSGASLPDEQWRAMRGIFDSARVDDAATRATIAKVWRDHGVLLDPHTAVGVRAAREVRAGRENTSRPNRENKRQTPMVCLATAHPAKFAEAITAAGLPAPALPERMRRQFERPERFQVIDRDLDELKAFLGRVGKL